MDGHSCSDTPQVADIVVPIWGHTASNITGPSHGPTSQIAKKEMVPILFSWVRFFGEESGEESGRINPHQIVPS